MQFSLKEQSFINFKFQLFEFLFTHSQNYLANQLEQFKFFVRNSECLKIIYIYMQFNIFDLSKILRIFGRYLQMRNRFIRYELHIHFKICSIRVIKVIQQGRCPRNNK